MSFTVITDTAANLDTRMAEERNISVIPFYYFVDGKEYTCTDTAQFNYHEYYDRIREGMTVTTSQVNPQSFVDYFAPILEGGSDIIFVCMSSGISGTFASAGIARQQLLEDYPQRRIRLIDSLGAGLGVGLLSLMAADYRDKGMDTDTAADLLKERVKSLYQVFIVDDLMHLRRTGRLSNISAIVGSVLGIKPLLKGNENGKIVAFEKHRGRKNAIVAMADKFASYARGADRIAISHADCEEDAKYLIKLLRERGCAASREIVLAPHEPVTGSHIGPGALALFFEGDEDVRLK